MIKKAIFGSLALLTLTGCMGRSALTGKVLKWNLEVSEDRWNREWTFLGLWLTLIYPICGFLDLLIFNSIEFWTGENNINGQSPLVDVPMSEVEKMGFNNIQKAQIERLTANDAKLHIDFKNGDKLSFDVKREAYDYTVSFRGVEYYQGKIVR